jgi:uncharacterized repeat protein (TIGR01451 family)
MKARVFFSTLVVVVLLGSLLTPLAAALEPTEADAGPSLDDLRGLVQEGLITVEEYKAAVAEMAPASPGTVLVGAAPEAVLLAEDFETWPPPGWTIVDNGGDCVWDSNTFYARPNYAGGDGQCADADSDACGYETTMDTELRSPLIDLSGALPGTVLQFVGAYDDLGTGDYAEILISPDGGTNWNQELYWNEPHSPSGPGEVVVIDMTPYLGFTEVIISFHYVAGWDWYFEIDQVRVQSPSPDLSESTKEVWPTKAEPGDVLTYTVHISNTGDAPAWQAVMTDVIPAGTAYVTDSVDCSFGDCGYDAGDDAVYWSQGVPPPRFFVANWGSANTVWEVDLIRAGQFVEDTWGVVNTCTVAGISDNVGIDYDAEHGVLYHSDYNSTNIVVTDLECNVLGSFTCAGAGVTRNTGVTYVEGSQPPEVWVTDFGSETTTRCEALLQQGVAAAPPPIILPDTGVASLRELNISSPGPAAPGDFIEQFPVDWTIGVVGLVYDPSRDWVRYAHESEPADTIWDVERPVPHTVLGSCALSAVNPGWPSTLDDKDGAGYDFLADTYFLADFNGDQAIRDDNIVEVDAQCNILNAWETAGIENDSYDGSVINTIMDIAVVPNPPPPEEVVVTFQVEVVDAPCGEPIVNEAIIYDPATFPVVVQAETLVVAGLYSMEDFEAGDGGYTSVGGDPWTWGPPPMGPAHSGVNAWSTESPYAPNADYQLLSAPIDLTTAPPDLVLQWWQDIFIQDATYDHAYVEITTDTVSYEILWQHTGGTYDSDGWEHRMADISGYAGEVVQLRFRMDTDSSDQYDGWAIDDVAIHVDCAGPDITIDPPSLHSEQCPGEQMTLEFSICNAGDQPLEWGVTEVPVDIPWLSEDPITGVVLLDECQVVDVAFDATGLAPDGYGGSLAIVSNDLDAPTTTLPISLTVLEPAAILTVTTVITDPTVAFDADVAGSLPITYIWDFGDGYGDVTEDPIHTYDSVGCYTVTLEVTNQCGVDDTSFEVCIEGPSFYYYLPMLYKNR